MPAGQYYLRVEPEGDTGGLPVGYARQVRRDVPTLLPYGVAFALLLVPPILVSKRAAAFELRRMQESDYGD